MPGPGGPGRGAPRPKERARNTGATIRRLWAYLNRQRAGLILVYILTALAALVTMISPYLLGVAIDRFITPGRLEGLLGLCLLLLGLYAGGAAATWLQAYVMTGVAQRMLQSLRGDLFRKYQQLPVSFFDTRTHGELMSRNTNDIENVSNGLNQTVTQMLTSLIVVIGSLVLMLRLNVWLTLVGLVTIPLVMLATRLIGGVTRRNFKAQQEKLGSLNGLIEESVGGQRTVQIFRREQAMQAEFGEINGELNRAAVKAQIVSGLVGPVMNMLNNMNFALIAAIGAWMVFRDMTSVGVIVSFLNYSRQFGRPISDLANQYNLIQSGVAGAERVFEILDLETEYEEEGELIGGASLRGEVAFDSVSFAYKPERPILQNVSFRAEPGQKIALVGPTGAGKTTIVNLLTRFYETTSGTISIDGRDIRELDKNDLRRSVGMVLQDAYVFAGTIRDNIRYGRLDAGDAEIERAAELANADSFIRALPRGYDTPLTMGGTNLSHGQRQLLTIARAVLADPAILILDEATSSIDTRTEMHIQEAMRSLMRGRTSFVIAHRLSTIRDADRILFMSGGTAAEQGTHDELLEARGLYYELYMSQFKRLG
ncbi:ABC transporter ATP-binding protein [Saccharibacillus sp. CPCC 101409]|uniref:ABC transporter ATP-binding protein n=1 Tax=Saccharibacillus sp. CPCC 101409 TaxID=3058041 RepID=UPI002670F6B4|nr:ABC transporter ATP-binding protein [Saccharibacillus sp. CPCC 101409]MDO3410825.1 ABC transporter ATP-binding protein [Saccharibacillus sp. CPCC 101409]